MSEHNIDSVAALTAAEQELARLSCAARGPSGSCKYDGGQHGGIVNARRYHGKSMPDA